MHGLWARSTCLERMHAARSKAHAGPCDWASPALAWISRDTCQSPSWLQTLSAMASGQGCHMSEERGSRRSLSRKLQSGAPQTMWVQSQTTYAYALLANNSGHAHLSDRALPEHQGAQF